MHPAVARFIELELTRMIYRMTFRHGIIGLCICISHNAREGEIGLSGNARDSGGGVAIDSGKGWGFLFVCLG